MPTPQDDEIRSLRAEVAALRGLVERRTGGVEANHLDPAVPTSRRHLLRTLAAGTAGAVVGTTVLTAEPAAAAATNLLSETINSTTAATEVRMSNASADVALVVQDGTSSSATSARPAALAGWSGTARAGVFGYSTGSTSSVGQSSPVQIAGVVGENPGNGGTGVLAVGDGPNGTGISAFGNGTNGTAARFEGKVMGLRIYTTGDDAGSLVLRAFGSTNADPTGGVGPSETGTVYVSEVSQSDTTIWYGAGGADGYRRMAGANTVGALTVLPSPVRLLDTRTGFLPAGNKGKVSTSTKSFNVTINGTGVPAHSRALLVNVTVTGSSAGGFMKVWPSQAAEPTASIINWAAGQSLANFVTVGIGSDDKVSVKASVATDLILDVTGYYR